MATCKSYAPESDDWSDDIFNFPFLVEEETTQFLLSHGRIMFIVRGLPGTGKNALKELIKSKFPDGIICTADDYFSITPYERTKETLKMSHEYCHKVTEKECKKGTHPIIVSNTGARNWELKPYFDYAAQYGYTIIIASTMDKLEVTPEILAKYNTKGLDETYMKRRLRGWENIIPILTGCFLSANDSLYALKALQSALGAALTDEKFCRSVNAYDKEELLNQYQAKRIIFSVAGYSKYSPLELEDYCKSDKVNESFGKCFKIILKAFIISKSDILAVTEMDDNSMYLMYESKAVESSKDKEIDKDMNDVADGFETMSTQNSYNFQAIPLTNDFSNEIKDGMLEESKSLNLSRCSYIHLAQKRNKPFSGWKTMQLFKDCLSSCISSSKNLPLESFSDLNDGYKMLRLPKERWMVKPPYDISFTTVFTGLYT